LYERELLRWQAERPIGFTVNAGGQLAAIRALPEAAWQPDAEETDAFRQWVVVAFVPDGGDYHKNTPALT